MRQYGRQFPAAVPKVNAGPLLWQVHPNRGEYGAPLAHLWQVGHVTEDTPSNARRMLTPCGLVAYTSAALELEPEAGQLRCIKCLKAARLARRLDRLLGPIQGNPDA